MNKWRERDKTYLKVYHINHIMSIVENIKYNAEPARNPIWRHSSRRQARDDRASGPPYVMWNLLFFIAACGT